jgi:hypothetical protein
MSTKENPGGTAITPDQNTTYDTRTLVTKTGSTRYEITAKANGDKVQRWCVGSIQALIIPGVKDPQLAVTLGPRLSALTNYVDYSKSDFPGFDWISRSNYVGVQMTEGVPCIVFQQATSDSASQSAPATTGTGAAPAANVAFISQEGRLPVLLLLGGESTLYQFRPPPTGPLTPPPNIQALFDEWNERVKRASAPPAPP